MCQRVRIQHICKRCKSHRWFENYSALDSKKTLHCMDYHKKENECRRGEKVERVTSGDRVADGLCAQCQNNPYSAKTVKKAREKERQLRNRRWEGSSGGGDNDIWVDFDEDRSPPRGARRDSYRSSMSSGGWGRTRRDMRDRPTAEYYDDERTYHGTGARRTGMGMRGPHDQFVRVEEYASGLPSRPRRHKDDDTADENEYRGPPVPAAPSSSQAQFGRSSSGDGRRGPTPPISPRSSVQGSVISGKGGRAEYERADSRSPSPAREQSRGPAQKRYSNPAPMPMPMPQMGRGPERPPFPRPVMGADRM